MPLFQCASAEVFNEDIGFIAEAPKLARRRRTAERGQDLAGIDDTDAFEGCERFGDDGIIEVLRTED
jgi:hypothetical protein